MTFTIQFNTIQISNTTKKIVLPYNIIMTGRGTAQIATIQFGQTTISNNTIFTTGQAIAKGTNIYYAVGSGTNTIAYTTDTGNTWTGVTSAPFTTSGYDILNLGSVWIAAGEGTNALAY